MMVTIVCVCGQHNAVHEQDLDRAICTCCYNRLLQPAPRAAAHEPVVLVTPIRAAIVAS